MRDKISSVKTDFYNKINIISNLKQLEELRVEFLTRNGKVASLFDELKSVSIEEKPLFGKLLNELKNELQGKYEELKSNLEENSKKDFDLIDLTLPGRELSIGHKHIITQTMDEIKSIFRGLGFSSYEGPEVESDEYNFEALNFPPDHPARDMQDTFFLSSNMLLRTHTTPIQIRLMRTKKPPIRAIMPGRVFRNEAVSARSYSVFHQIDGLFVDKDVSFAELKGTLVAFATQYYGDDLKYRFRTSFFPFTEPSAEMDITCFICKGKGCRVCKNSGWLEILGCGMVDPNVFLNCDYDPENISGYAFGMGIERIAMLKHGITDIRILYDNDFRFLKQF